MKRSALGLLLLAAFSLAARGEIPPGWSTNYSAVAAEAAAADQPMLLYFTASWCGPCKLMCRTTLAEPDVLATMKTLKHVAVDIDEQPELAAAWEIKAVPTFVLLANTNDAGERVTGYQPAGDFLPWLTNGLATVQRTAARRVANHQELAAIDALLAANTTNATQEALAKLYRLGDSRDASVASGIVHRMEVIAARDPAALLDGLNDPSLATRIQVANALAQKIGERFDIDPWSNAATRREKIIAWKNILLGTR